MTDRKPGWYFTKKGGLWHVCYFCEYWCPRGEKGYFCDDFWDVIGERVKMPDEKPPYNISTEYAGIAEESRGYGLHFNWMQNAHCPECGELIGVFWRPTGDCKTCRERQRQAMQRQVSGEAAMGAVGMANAAQTRLGRPFEIADREPKPSLWGRFKRRWWDGQF